MPRDWWVLAGFLVLCFSCEAAFNYFVHEGMLEWYATLKKPSWAIPGFYIGPMATFSYSCMALAGWFTWRSVGQIKNAPAAFILYSIQIALFTLWAYFFFIARELHLSFYILAALAIILSANTYYFWRLCLLAGLLLLPYLLWVYYLAAFNNFVAAVNG